MAKKSILMLVGDFVEDYEVMVPFQALLMIGHMCMPFAQVRKPDKKCGLPSTTLKAIRPTARSRGTILLSMLPSTK